MKVLLNKYVEHIKYGRGMIIKEDTGKITVEFHKEKGNKKFLYPEAFEHFLKFEDSILQEESLLLLQSKTKLIAEEKERLRLEQKRLEEEQRLEARKQKKKQKPANKAKKTKVENETYESEEEE